MRLLVDPNLQAGLRQDDRGREAIGAGSDDDGVEIRNY